MSISSPLQWLSDWLVYRVLQLPHTRMGEAASYFIFDAIKILLLLAVIIFAVSVIRTFLPPEKIRGLLSGKRRLTGKILAAALGIVTPFCSCSAIPMFLGFAQAGVPLGTTFAFLVASPMINEVVLVLLLGLFGWKIALLYVLSGLIIAILSGIAIGHLRPEGLVENFVLQNTIHGNVDLPRFNWADRFGYAKTYTGDILKKVWLYVVIGIAAGAWIHGYVPTGFLAHYAGSDKWYAVPVAVLVGIPLYSSAAGIIPLAGALTQKGVAMGTTLAFMMSVTALSLPEFMILKKVMKLKLIAIFAGIVGLGIMFTGFLFNWLL